MPDLQPLTESELAEIEANLKQAAEDNTAWHQLADENEFCQDTDNAKSIVYSNNAMLVLEIPALLAAIRQRDARIKELEQQVNDARNGKF